MKQSVERKVLWGLALATLVIVAVAVVGHAATSRMIDSAGAVTRCYELIEHLADLTMHTQAVRMSTRGYILTGDAALLRIHDDARAHTEAHLAGLRAAMQRDGKRRARLEEIVRLVTTRLADSERLLEMSHRQGRLVAGLAAAGSIHIDIDDPLHERVQTVISDARTELHARQRVARNSGLTLFIVLAFGALMELAVAGVAAAAIRRELRARRRHAEVVEQKELTLRSFYDSDVTMMGIIELLDDDVRFISGNTPIARMFGTLPGELPGKLASALGTPPDLLGLYVEHLRESLRVGGPVEFEYERGTPDGRKGFSAVLCPIRRWAPAGRQRFSYIVLDVTARKAAEAALRRHTAELVAAKEALERQSAQLEQARRDADAANAAKSSFLANMSHEIRTPMTAVLGYGDLLVEPGRSDDERAEWVGVIRRNARHLLELINDVLDLSKIEAGHMTLEAIACDPAQVLGDVVAMMQPRAREKGIILRLDIESPLPRQMLADPLRLRQVLVNLVGNAVKFTQAGEVSVRAVCDDEDGGAAHAASLQIAVRDTGIGMTPGQLAKVFRPFTQADETMTRRFGGSGLGLTITQRLVHLMNGRLDVQSEAAMGSTFTVTLPVVRVATAGAAATPDGGGAHAADERNPLAILPSGGRVLLAEDTADTQRLVALLLDRAGAHVTTVSTGADALAAVAAAHHAFDVILMDMQMAQVDGYTAAAELRRRGVRTPIVAVTAHAMAGDRERCLAAGCTDYLTKPIDRDELLRCVARYLSRPAALVA